MPLLPVALYGLEVPCGDILVPAVPDFPATFRITMAAIDPSEEPEIDENSNISRPRATLKIIRQPIGAEDDEYLRAMLADSDSDSDEDSIDSDDSADEEANGGPSDPSKSKKAKKAAALKELMQHFEDSAGGAKSDDASDEEMDDVENGINGTNGAVASKKGKAKATDEDEEDSEDDDSDGEDLEVEEFVLCTLDTDKNYQQPLDITIAENENVFFKVSGTHSIYLTGNYVIPDDDGHNHHHEVYDSDSGSEADSDDEEVDLSPDEDELEFDMDDESDDLDALEDPRITEVDSDEEEAPKLIKGAQEKKAEKKGKNKRTADDLEEGTSLDDIISKSLKTDTAEDQPKLSKKQLKRLKKNNGEAAAVKPEEQKNGVAKDVTSAKSDKSDKKVQFAKNLEQGPTGSAEKPKAAEPAKDSGKPKLGPKKVKGVTVDDKKLGSGPACKKGDRVGMRYIGKLNDGKVFDSNKSGKPFTFKLGVGEVITGWDIGVAGMSVGGERRLTIPANLAYGSKQMPGIPANSALTFDIKLLEIK